LRITKVKAIAIFGNKHALIQFKGNPVIMLGTEEMLFVLVVALLIFGPDRMPELARSLGKFMAEFKKAERSVELDEFDTFRKQEKSRENKTLHDKIRNMAVEMEINVEGKTDDELLDEIRRQQCLSVDSSISKKVI